MGVLWRKCKNALRALKERVYFGETRDEKPKAN